MKHLKIFEEFIALAEKEMTPKEKKEKEKKVAAMSDGKVPIVSDGDIKNAISAFSSASGENKAKMAKHIARRAKALDKPDLIPTDDKFKEALKTKLTPQPKDKK